MTRQRLLLTGGLGFQGFHLASAWAAEGRAVTLLNTPSPRARALVPLLPAAGLRIVWGSVNDPEILEKVVPEHDAVVHLAAWASVDVSLARPRPPFEINTHGTQTLLEAVRQYGDPGVRLLIASSCEVYGPVQGDGLQTEETPLQPCSPYAASKAAADRIAYAYARAFDLDLVILRPSNVYGPHQRTGRAGAVIPTFVDAALAGAALTVTGTGAQEREFLWVEDVVAAYTRALDRPARTPGRAFNIGSGEIVSVLGIAQRVVSVLGLPPTRILRGVGRPAEVTGFRLDSARASAELGWRARVSFDDGLQRYLKWRSAWPC